MMTILYWGISTKKTTRGWTLIQWRKECRTRLLKKGLGPQDRPIEINESRWSETVFFFSVNAECYLKKCFGPLWVIIMPRHQKVAGYYVIPSEILSVRPSVRPSVCLSVRPSVSAHHHSCIGNSSYSFRPILLKLYRCFKDGLKICILFFQNPEIIFYHFFPIFN